MNLHDFIVARAKEVGNYILANNATVRQTGKVMGVSKSTVYKDIERLEKINPEMYREISQVMQQHFKIKHIHGGESTRKRWQLLKQS